MLPFKWPEMSSSWCIFFHLLFIRSRCALLHWISIFFFYFFCSVCFICGDLSQSGFHECIFIILLVFFCAALFFVRSAMRLMCRYMVHSSSRYFFCSLLFRAVVYVMRYGICSSRRCHHSMRREPIAIYLKDGWPVDGLMCVRCCCCRLLLVPSSLPWIK